MKNVRVLMTVASMAPHTGGPARSVPGLASEIKNCGGQVALFVNDTRFSGDQHFDVPVYSIRKLSVFIKSLSLEERALTLIHNNGIWLPINHQAAVVAQQYNIPLMNSPRGMLEPWALNFRNFKKKIAWHFYQYRDLKNSSVLHATADSEAQNLRFLGFKMPIAVVPNGIHFPVAEKVNVQFSSSRTALFLSRIHPKKGLIEFIQAWSKISPPGWRVLIAGPDESNHSKEVLEVVKQCKLSEVVSFCGPVDDEKKWELYGQADLFILPSHSENFGIVVAEALASGVPVITTKGTPWSDLECYGCGWWVDTSVQGIAEAIDKAVGLEPQARFNMGEKGRRLVAKKYSMAKTGGDMLKVYQWLVNGGQRPNCVFY